MNAKQSLKVVAKRLEEVEIVLARAKVDIKHYNEVIDSMIAGGSPCDWCEDQTECQLTAKAEGKGCPEWWLIDQDKVTVKDGDGGDESKGLFPESGESGGKAEALAGKITAF